MRQLWFHQLRIPQDAPISPCSHEEHHRHESTCDCLLHQFTPLYGTVKIPDPTGFPPPPTQTCRIAHNTAWLSCAALGGYVLRRMNWLLYQSLKAESLNIPPGAVFVVGAGDWSLTARAGDGTWLTSAEGLALVL